MGLRVLQFGKTGQVGLELLTRGIRRGHQISALGREVIDLAQPGRVAAVVAAAGPVDVVINGAAYTAVDRAESEADKAYKVNCESVAVLAEACAKRGVPLIQLSTDYVFDGTKPGAYCETDVTNPLNVYGRSKLAGEMAVQERQPMHIILRTSWIFSAHGSNFVKTMLRLGVERDELRIVDDQIGAPTFAGDIADTCLRLCATIQERKADIPWGTYHFTASGETSWRGCAEEIFARARAWTPVKAKVVPIPTSAYPTPAKRPLNSRLDCRKIAHTFGIERRPWQAGLSDALNEIRDNQRSVGS
jgi:dTDP-4-dehydrorhamnose reductase